MVCARLWLNVFRSRGKVALITCDFVRDVSGKSHVIRPFSYCLNYVPFSFEVIHVNTMKISRSSQNSSSSDMVLER
ncbi:hypothetical protein L6452_35880 [Arctium lappa]|uniref:Uncharacterized protein n=1 Tax=Arctium lappa TaxID=4217 RepID=A0ACB8YBU7_ARCLA|nr:hypothetical protein L6452_35880 [Arctium lappa]